MDSNGIIEMLSRMLHTARNLSEPEEPNAEYIRGQVNLIQDLYGLNGNDVIYDTLTSAISYEISVEAALTIIADEMT